MTTTFFFLSLRSAVFRGGGHLWSFPQFVSQRSPVHLQRPGGAPHPDQVEAPGVRQPGCVLRQPISRLLLAQPGHPGPGPLLQVEDGHGGLRRQHR